MGCIKTDGCYEVADLSPGNSPGRANDRGQFREQAMHSTGHVWQGRYYSCPLDQPHLWEALRYTELSPVRAGMVHTAERWAWSSATARFAGSPEDGWLAVEMWRSRWTDASWREYLEAGESESKLGVILRYTHTGRPLGGAEFFRALER